MAEKDRSEYKNKMYSITGESFLMFWVAGLIVHKNVTCSSSSLPVPAKLRELRCFLDFGYCIRSDRQLKYIKHYTHREKKCIENVLF